MEFWLIERDFKYLKPALVIVAHLVGVSFKNGKVLGSIPIRAHA